MGEVKNIPELRFNGFSEEWEQKRITEVARVFIGLVTTMTTFYRKSGILLIRNSDIKNNYFSFADSPIYLDEKFASDNASRKLQVEDIVTVHTGDVGTSAVISKREDGAIGFATINTRPDKSLVDSNYLSVYFNSEPHKSYAILRSTGDGRANYNLSDFLQLVIPIPKIEEQKTIGTFFKNLDNQITLKQHKLDKLVTLKKAMLEKMFPKDGADEPEIRFKGFTGAWLDKSFGQMATFFNGRAYKQEELLSTGKYRVLRVGNFFSNNQWYFSDLELESNKYCDNGDLLYAWSASFGPRIWHGEKVIYHYHIWKVVENDGIDRQFLHLLLDFETENMKSNSANGMGLLHITKGTIEGWECSYPENIGEQKAIGFYFKKLDDLISLQKIELTKLKQIKSSCLEKMFV